jgi:hypothetical protein
MRRNVACPISSRYYPADDEAQVCGVTSNTRRYIDKHQFKALLALDPITSITYKVTSAYGTRPGCGTGVPGDVSMHAI